MKKRMSYVGLKPEEETALRHQDLKRLIQMADLTNNKHLKNICIALLKERARQ
jgi:hypothetical protein